MTVLRDKLKRGDLAVIATIAGVSYDTARQTLSSGRRNNKAVQQVAAELIADREKLSKKFQKKA
ncbi:hypothetical protein [Dyadobacter frigoris]|uniref:Uncharacterized protein n=1 Tax=Dyadobacter frigoris TaxID=2576211 RepID=A0A4U6D074_9BACT|nr:hypothetical protein [Dyadobacter frigoris]TKT89507.1 hypothetical protein FDK13_24500 [Dyadobacter frigoris]